MWKNKNVLVTGGKGMIGRELVEQLDKLGTQVSVADIKTGGDMANYNHCLQACEDMDYVFHLVGKKGNPKLTNEKPVDFMGVMLQCDTNMIIAAQAKKVKRFLYTSSIAVEHPEHDKYPAWAKKTAETLIEAMRIQYPSGTKYCIVRPANVYGRFDNFKDTTAMVITSLISKAVFSQSPSLEVWGDGSQIRDFINAKDAARGMIKAMEEMPEFPVNLCSGEGAEILKIAEIISSELSKPIKFISIEGKVMGDNKRIMELNWDFKPEIDIESGLREVVKWVKENGNQV